MRASTSTKSATHPSVNPATPSQVRLYNVSDVRVEPLPVGMNEPSPSRRIGANGPGCGTDSAAWRSVYTSHEHDGRETEAFDADGPPTVSLPALAATVPA